MTPELRAAFISSTQAGADGRYDATRDAHGAATFGHLLQGFEAKLDGTAVRLTPPELRTWELSLRTASVGCEGWEGDKLEAGAVETSGNRVEISRGAVREWYVNGPLGLEQGFTLERAPNCTGMKVIAMDVGGNLVPVLKEVQQGRGQAVDFVDGSGATVVRYADLYVKDATGKRVSAWMGVADGTVSLHVDDVGAAYPLDIDPLMWVEGAMLLADDGDAGDEFGWVLAMDGDTAVVGLPYDYVVGSHWGSAYVFVRNGTVWTQQQKLWLNDQGATDLFGYTVALSGDTAFIGAPYEDALPPTPDAPWETNEGAVYVYVRSGTTWSLQQKLSISNFIPWYLFGSAVAVIGDTALVGAEGDYQDCGAAYVYTRSGTVWTQQQKLTPSVYDPRNSLFGGSIAMSGDTALIGARWDFEQDSKAGAAYVFVRNGSLWTQQQKLMATDGQWDDYLGTSVALSGDTALVGAPSDDDLGVESGSAYVFTRSGTVWSQQQKLLASDGTANDQFGTSVALLGDTALVGAPSNNAGARSGSAYVFTRTGTVWAQQQKLIPTGADPYDYFGLAVALLGDTAFVGMHSDDVAGNWNQGSVRTFRIMSVGATCTSAAQCASGYCVDGVCCNAACGGGVSNDCQACSVAAGATADGVCALLALGSECRAAAGPCDTAEVCDGMLAACPTDWKFAGTPCRPLAGACDVVELCDGISDACPTDGWMAAGTPCRAAAGVCDVPESCDGASNTCPVDILAAAGTPCRPLAGACDVVELCDGISDACPTDGWMAAGTPCRAAAGVCDTAESCDGASNACPADIKVAAGAQCRAAAGVCDVADNCDGISDACPVDTKVAAGTQCRAAAGVCDTAESCDGISNVCPADTKVAAGTQCRASAGICDAAESCDGISGACPADKKVAVGIQCRAPAGICDATDRCDGASDECPADAKVAAGTQCRARAGICDAAESCDGISDACPVDTKVAAGTQCRASAGICDVAESCDGASNACPVDTKVAAGTQCRAAVEACDAAESCDGASVDCPTDINLPDGTTCRGGTCTHGVCAGTASTGGAGGAGGGGGAGAGGGAGTGTGGAATTGGAAGAGGGGGGEAGGPGNAGSAGEGGAVITPPNGTGCSCRVGGGASSDFSSAALVTLTLAGLLRARRRTRLVYRFRRNDFRRVSHSSAVISQSE